MIGDDPAKPRQLSRSAKRRKAASVSSLTWCSMPSASFCAVSGETPSAISTLSTISSTQQEAFLAMFLFVMPAIILSGFLYPVETMPDVFQTLTLANPLRHFLEIVRGIFLKGAGVGDLAVQFGVLSLMAGGGLVLTARRFRASL